MDRAFVAVEVPPVARDAIAVVAERLRDAGLHGRWVQPSAYHVTLVFLGPVADQAAVVDRMAVAARLVDPFRVTVSGVGGFPSTSRATVAWVGVEDDGAMSTLAHSLDPDARAFRAHVTLARFARPTSMPVVSVPEVSFAVPSITLVESILQRGRSARYDPVTRVDLGRV